MSLLDSLATFATGTYAVTRTTYAAPVNGRYTPSTSTLLISAVVVPYGGELAALPEGVSASETRVIGAACPLLDAKDGRAPDSIHVGSEDYLVFRVDGPVIMPGSTHYRAYAARRRLP